MTRTARLAAWLALPPTLVALAAMASAAAAPEGPTQQTVLTAETGVLRTVGSETRGVFEGSVTLIGTNLKIFADRIEILAEGITENEKGITVPPLQKIKRLLATGHVRIVQGSRTATAGQAEVLPREEVVILTEDPIVVDKAEDGRETTASGSRIQWHRGDSALDIKGFRGVFPDIPDLGFTKEKEKDAPTARPESGRGAPAAK